MLEPIVVELASDLVVNLPRRVIPVACHVVPVHARSEKTPHSDR
eukprot:COSAG01_NODE_46413_length_400_cov_1.205980_1_plen_43_part_10